MILLAFISEATHGFGELCYMTKLLFSLSCILVVLVFFLKPFNLSIILLILSFCSSAYLASCGPPQECWSFFHLSKSAVEPSNELVLFCSKILFLVLLKLFSAFSKNVHVCSHVSTHGHSCAYLWRSAFDVKMSSLIAFPPHCLNMEEAVSARFIG